MSITPAFFTTLDFLEFEISKVSEIGETTSKVVARVANKKLWTALGPRVKGSKNSSGQWCMGEWESEDTDTHEAVLFNLQKLPPLSPETCPHKRVDGDYQSGETWCMDCKHKVKFVAVLDKD